MNKRKIVIVFIGWWLIIIIVIIIISDPIFYFFEIIFVLQLFIPFLFFSLLLMVFSYCGLGFYAITSGQAGRRADRQWQFFFSFLRLRLRFMFYQSASKRLLPNNACPL